MSAGAIMELMLDHCHKEHKKVYQGSIVLFKVYWSQFMSPCITDVEKMFVKKQAVDIMPYIA